MNCLSFFKTLCYYKQARREIYLMGEKTKYGYKHNDGHYSKMTGGKGNNSSY